MVRAWRLLNELKNIVPPPHSFWTFFGLWWLIQGKSLPSWEEFQGWPPGAFAARLAELRQVRKIRESIPDWLDKLGETEFKEEWEPLLNALNQKADVVIRANTLKISQAELAQRLHLDHIDTRPVGTDGLVLLQRRNLFTHPDFKEGLFELQDAASQQVAPALDVKPGMRVIDACAGAGGKSLHLAALMNNQGTLIALDKEEWKLQELKKRARRAGVHIVNARVINNNKVIKRLYDSADRVLLDVPCSGLGVLRRNPDTKWKLNPTIIQQLQITQQTILQNYARLCKKGGKLVYATCSILPSENYNQIQNFIDNCEGGFELIAEKNLLPHKDGFDGFYIAVMKRT